MLFHESAGLKVNEPVRDAVFYRLSVRPLFIFLNKVVHQLIIIIDKITHVYYCIPGIYIYIKFSYLLVCEDIFQLLAIFIEFFIYKFFRFCGQQLFVISPFYEINNLIYVISGRVSRSVIFVYFGHQYDKAQSSRIVTT